MQGDHWLEDVVRKIDGQGIISTVAGTGIAGFAGDCGPGTSAQVNVPNGLAFHDGALFVADSNNYRIRMVVP